MHSFANIKPFLGTAGTSVAIAALFVGACAESKGTEETAPPISQPDARADVARDAREGGSLPSDSAVDGAMPEAASDPDATSETGTDGAVAVVPPVADGNIGAGEYGVHVSGQNMQASDVDAATPTTWYLTWDDNNVYVGITSAAVGEGVVIYFDKNPLSPPSSGTDGDGSLVGQPYDSTRLNPLPIRADAVVYAKTGYQELRVADGAGSWGPPQTSAVTFAGTGATRELAIPWTAISSGARPSSFSWLGYATSNAGYVYGEMPPSNAGGMIGTDAQYTHFYSVTDATPGTGTKPFAIDATP